MTADETTELADLVRERRAELRLSLRDLAERTIDPENQGAGALWKRGTLANLENDTIKPPKLPELRALAAGLECPLGLVQDAAAAQFMGIVSEVWSDSGNARALVAHYEELSDREKAQVQAMVEAFSRSRGKDST